MGIVPHGYTSYLDYLTCFDDNELLEERHVPFWVRTFISCLDLIGPETDDNLERILRVALEEPTYARLHAMRDTLRADIAVVRGPKFNVDITMLGRKYGVLLNLLDGLWPEPFYQPEWVVSIGYAMQEMELDSEGEARLEERLKEAVRQYEPDSA